MANEITILSKLTCNKGGSSITNATSQKIITMQSDLEKKHHSDQAVGTTKEALSTGDVDLTEEHIVVLQNLDPTNYVDVFMRGDATPTDVLSGRIRPGEFYGPARLAAQSSGYPALYLQANTAACDVEVLVCEAGDPAL